MVQAPLRHDCLRVFLLSPCVTKLILGDALKELGRVHSVAIWIVAWNWNGKRNIVLDRDLGGQLLINTVWVLLARLYRVSMWYTF